MNEQREHDIAQGLRQGEPDAWRALYDAYAPAVWNAVARRLGPYSADVADVVQETFLAAARTARNFDSAQGTLWSWLSGIARHHVAQYFRKQQRQTRIVQAAEALGPQHDEGDGLARASRSGAVGRAGHGGNGAPGPRHARQSLGRVRGAVDPEVSGRRVRGADGGPAVGLGDGGPLATGPRATGLPARVHSTNHLAGFDPLSN